MAGIFSLTNIILAICAGYLFIVISQIYVLFNPPACDESSPSSKNDCLFPFVKRTTPLELRVTVTESAVRRDKPTGTTIWHVEKFFMNETVETVVNVTLPVSTAQNGSLYAHIFLRKAGSPQSSHYARAFVPLTRYAPRQKAVVSLLDMASSSNSTPADPGGNQSSYAEPPMTHWKPSVYVHIADTDMAFSRAAYPGDIGHLFQWAGGRYLPVLYVNDMAVRYKELMPVEANATAMPLKLHISPYMLGRVRVWVSFAKSFDILRGLGFSDKDMDEVKELFRIRLLFLAMTFFVSFVHLLFDFLAFKNDISYWRARKTMAGLSRNVVLYRCVSQVIIFLYLVDEQTSLLVTVPNGIACFIEVWKVTKALKVKVRWRGLGCLPALEFGTMSSVEEETQGFDSLAFRYLSYVMYPMMIGCAVYSLVYLRYTSWWSWLVHSMANGIYTFGFLMMLPQLFVNYKMKSVAHLPWRVFTYKAFNTFIDDIFAFIITMPTAHRIAVFRDDLVFVVYLYQRWLYPVDMKRANEFGVSYDDDGQGVISTVVSDKPTSDDLKASDKVKQE